jgi:electron transfer flavoprotein-quinone oxidoreductase
MTADDQLDAVIVGAGLAGLACAYEAAGAGLQVAVLERGDAAGSKSLSGGRLYLPPLRELCADFLQDAPFERPVVSESIVLTDNDSSLAFRLDNGEQRENPNSVTVTMSSLLRHLAEKVSEKGALVLTRQKAEELIRENGKVAGVKIAGEELRARTVVAADGVLSFLALEAGLRLERPANLYGIGIKETIQMDGSRIEERFNLPPGQGAARLYMGMVTRGLPGGGFIYTNRDSLSIGLVVHLKSLSEWQSETEVWELLEAFKKRPDVAPLLAGGTTVEYGAHLIPEGGFSNMSKPGIPGLLLIGDAAGLVLNSGTTLRGMDLALASGVLAGRSIVQAHEGKLGPEACLRVYGQALKTSFVYKQMKAYKRAPDVLLLKRLFERYPQRMVRLTRDIFQVNGEGRSLSFREAGKNLVFKILGWHGARDLWRILRMGS